MADTSAAIGTVSYWGSGALLLYLGCKWVERRVNKSWQREDAAEEAAKMRARQDAASLAAAKLPPPPQPSIAAELEGATIALARARLEVEKLQEDMRRLRRTADDLETEDNRKLQTITSLRALLESARTENLTLRNQLGGSRHGPDTTRSARDPDRDRGRGQPARGGWPLAREEVGPPARSNLRRQGSD